MKRPAKVKVLGKVYAIQYTEGAPLADDDDGECDPSNQTITVRTGQSLECEQDTVLHEVIHAIENLQGLKLKHSDVVRLTTAIHALIRDNPGLMAYLRSRNASSRL